VIKFINILLLNWNSSDDIISLIENILKSDYQDYRIILIDNDSEKNDQLRIIELYNRYKETINIHLLINDKNYGYAGGNNRGYDYLNEMKLDGDILVINPDVEISGNTLTEMIKILNENVGAVMTRTLKPDGTILYDYIKLCGFRQKWLVTNDEIVETDFAAGSCMLLKREIIDQIGLFDEAFFMYWEEVDLSIRIKEKGYRLVSTTKTNVVRKDNSRERSLKAIYFYIRNSFFLYKKNKNFKLRHLIIFILLSCFIVLKKYFIFKDYRYLEYYFKGIYDGISN